MIDHCAEIADFISLENGFATHELALYDTTFVDEKDHRHQRPLRTPLPERVNSRLVHGADREHRAKTFDIILQANQPGRVDRSADNSHSLGPILFLNVAQDLSVILAVWSSGEQERQNNVLASELFQVQDLFIERLGRPWTSRTRYLLGEAGDGQADRQQYTQEYFLHYFECNPNWCWPAHSEGRAFTQLRRLRLR